jgi:hypothetical protein
VRTGTGWERRNDVNKTVIGCLLLVLATNAFGFYTPQQGRWLSRDPINERGGNNYYCFVKNRPVLLIDPLGLAFAPSNGNPDLTWDYDLKYVSLSDPELVRRGGQGARALTWTSGNDIQDGPPDASIVRVGSCCAKVEHAESTRVIIHARWLDQTAIGNAVNGVTAQGRNEILGHERRRARAILAGISAFYGPVSGQGSIALKCGVVCRKKGWEEARDLLSDYLNAQRFSAWQQYDAYEHTAQGTIGQDDYYQRYDSSDNPGLMNGYFSTFLPTAPTSFNDTVPCPLSDTP